MLLENRYTLQEHWGTIGSILWELITARKLIIQHLPLPCYDVLALAIAPTISSCFACSILKCYFSIQPLLAVYFSVFLTLSPSPFIFLLCYSHALTHVSRLTGHSKNILVDKRPLNLLLSNQLHKLTRSAYYNLI